MSKKSLPILLLSLVVFVGGLLRFYRLNWDDNQHVHPDERHITWVATTIQWPANLNTWAGWQAAFDPARSSFNPFYWPSQDNDYKLESPHNQPRSFAYGHFPLYLLVGAAHALDMFAKTTHVAGEAGLLDYDSLTLIGRAISGLFDIGTIIIAFLLGRRLYGKAAGLLAAAFLAFTPLHIQLAHFYAFDTVMTCFVLAALWQATCYLQEKRLRHLLSAGVCAGLAIGSKFTAIWLLPILAAPIILDLWPALQRRDLQVLKPLVFMLAVAFVAFAITNPFALIDLKTFAQEVADQGTMVRGGTDWPYTRQYHNTLPFIYPLSQMLRFGLGPALSVAGWAGLIWGLWRAWRQTLRLDEMPLLLWAASYFALTGGLYIKFVRYMLPMIPSLAILAAAFLVNLLCRSAIPKVAAGSLIAITLVATMLSGLAFARMYDGEHPWIAASRWVYDNVPAGAFIIGEYWDDHLPLNLEEPTLLREKYRLIELQPYDEPDSPEKLEGILSELAGRDYIIFPTHRLWGTIPRWPERYPLTTLYYRALFGERLGYRLEFFAARYPHLGPVTFMDQPLTDPALPIPPSLRAFRPSPIVIGLGRADESFTVYDHPLTLIFRNVERLTPEQMLERMKQAYPEGLSEYDERCRTKGRLSGNRLSVIIPPCILPLE